MWCDTRNCTREKQTARIHRSLGANLISARISALRPWLHLGAAARKRPAKQRPGSSLHQGVAFAHFMGRNQQCVRPASI
jgi:hypothetical protein